MAFQRLDLRHADAQAMTRAVALAVGQIARDGLVVLPTETVYGVAADPRRPSSIARLVDLKGRPDQQPFTHHLASNADVEHFAAPLSRAARRLARRYWPGPLTMVLPARTGGEVGLRLPAHAFAQRVIAACGPSLYLTSVNRSGEPALLTPDAIAAGFGDRIDLLCDAGPPPLQLSSSVVRIRSASTAPGIEVLREGILSREEILATAAATVLFVCTGNTCRSPMAEALARKLAAARWGIEPPAVLTRGLRFVSAGLAAGFGEPASEGAVRAAAEVGCNLEGHVAQPLTLDMLEQAEKVYCMSESHLTRLLALSPAAAQKVELLRRDAQDVGDPYGMSLPCYRQARDEIGAALAARWEEIARLV